MSEERDKTPEGLAWDGRRSSFPLLKTECEAKAVAYKCTHVTIVNDAARAAYPAGTATKRKAQQEKFWAFLILTFAKHDSTLATDFPVTNVECGTVL